MLRESPEATKIYCHYGLAAPVAKQTCIAQLNVFSQEGSCPSNAVNPLKKSRSVKSF